MVNATPEEFVSEWGRGLKGSVEKIKRRVDRVTEAPGAKAAASIDKARSKL